MIISEYLDIKFNLIKWYIQCRDLNVQIYGPILKKE